jgi:DNA/RNA endonuclease G (NUC1)
MLETLTQIRLDRAAEIDQSVTNQHSRQERWTEDKQIFPWCLTSDSSKKGSKKGILSPAP